MSRKKVGILCMIAGVLLVGAALLLFLHNYGENIHAGQTSEQILAELQTAVSSQTDPEKVHLNPYDEDAIEASFEMSTVEIDGYEYIGYLEIPVLKLELPIMSAWDYPRLKIAPCRQLGSTKSDDLVLAGHNYQKHFGSLSSLHIGDLVLFTDMDGEINYYLVDTVDVISPYATETVKNSQWGLVLYTCTYGGQSRVMVGCQRVTQDIIKSLHGDVS